MKIQVLTDKPRDRDGYELSVDGYTTITDLDTVTHRYRIAKVGKPLFDGSAAALKRYAQEAKRYFTEVEAWATKRVRREKTRAARRKAKV